MKDNSLLGIIRYDSKAFFIAVALHLIILLALVISVTFSPTPELTMTTEKVDIVQAVMVDSRIVQAEMDKIKKHEAKIRHNEKARLKKLADNARKEEKKRKQAIKNRKLEEKRLAVLKKKRLADEKARKIESKKLAALQKKNKQLEQQRQAEQQRLAVLQKKRKQEELARENAKKAAADRKRRIAEAKALKKKLVEEERERYLNSSKMKKLRSQYVKLIERHVEKKWIKPASSSKGMSCVVNITQNRAGTVLSVKTGQCSGDKAFRQSVERAVRRASPLPDAPSNDVFDRTIRFVFRP